MIYKVWLHLGIVVVTISLFFTIGKGLLEKYRVAGKFLLAHVLVSHVFFLLELRWSYLTIHHVDYLRFLSILDAILFLPGVLLFAALNLFVSDQTFRMSAFHLFPSLIHAVVAICLLVIGQDYYGYLYEWGGLRFYYRMVEFGILTFNGFFLLKSFLLVTRLNNDREERDEYPWTAMIRMYAGVLIAGYAIHAIAFGVRFFLTDPFVFNIYEVSRGILLVGLIFLLLKLWFSPQLFQYELVQSDLSNPRLGGTDIQSLKARVEALISKEQVYLNDDLTLSQMSERMSASPNDLSWLLNNTYDQGFYEFINYHRIQHFLRKIEEAEHLDRTILSLALESGFRSNATFYKAFKQMTGQTPKEYIKAR